MDAARPQQRPHLQRDVSRRTHAAASCVVCPRHDRHVDRVDADARMPRGCRRQSSRDFFRKRPRARCSAGRSQPSAPTHTTASISFAPSQAPDAQDLFEHSAESHELFERLLSEGRGIIVVTGHCGNWEMGSFLMRRTMAAHLTIIAMAEANPDVNRIRNSIRERLGAETLEVRQSLDTALQIRRRLGDNQMVAILMDRHLGRDRVAVTLLGRHAWFLRTPALLSYLTGAPLLPCFINRVSQDGSPFISAIRFACRRNLPRDDAIQCAAQAVRRSTRRTPPETSRALVSLLPLLGRAARFVRRTRLAARDHGPAVARHLRPNADRARSARPFRSRRHRRGRARRTRT